MSSSALRQFRRRPHSKSRLWASFGWALVALATWSSPADVLAASQTFEFTAGVDGNDGGSGFATTWTTLGTPSYTLQFSVSGAAPGEVYGSAGFSGDSYGIGNSRAPGGTITAVISLRGYTFDLTSLKLAQQDTGGSASYVITTPASGSQSGSLTAGEGFYQNIAPSGGGFASISSFTVSYTAGSGSSQSGFSLDSLVLDNIVATSATPTDARISIAGATGNGGAYRIGDTVTATWNNTAATGDNLPGVTGVTVDFSQFGGGTAVAATNAGGMWTASYTITAGSINGTAGRNVSITATNGTWFATTADSTNAVVDTMVPTVSSILRSGGTAAISNAATAEYTVTFAEAVTGVGAGSFILTATGTTSGTVGTVTAVSSTVYTVAVSGITGEGTLRLDLKSSGSGVTDAAGNAARGFSAGNVYIFDHTGPAVGSTGVPPGATYVAGSALDFTVTFNESVTVNTAGGTPSVPVTLNTGGTVQAAYVSGSGSNTLTFRYVVAAGNNDPDGIVVGTAISTNGATLRDAVGNNATLSGLSFGSTGAVRVDAVAPTLAITSDVATLKSGQTATITFTFSEDPGSSFTAGSVASSGGTLGAIVGSGLTRTATFTPTPAINSGTASITVASGAYIDAAGNNGGAGTTPMLTFDTLAPAAPGTPVLNTASDTGVSNSDRITSATTPTITGTAEANTTVTLYDTDGTTLLGITTADGSGNWSITSSRLAPRAHTLTAKATDAAGNVSLASAGLTAVIDTTAPQISSVSVPASATYGTGSPLEFTVSFTEVVTVDTTSGTPSIALVVGANTRSATYISGSQSSSLLFRYIVAANDEDNDGISLGALQAPGGAMRDVAGNSANLVLNGVGSTTGVLVGRAAAVPAAPVLNPATPGDGQVTLSWVAPADNGRPITGYTAIAYTTSPGAPLGTCSTTAATATTCTVLGLVNGTTHWFTVTATNAIGGGAASAAVTATPVKKEAVGTIAGMTGMATVEIGGGSLTCTLASSDFNTALPAGAPAGSTQPAGVFGFRTTGCPGDQLTVTLNYPQPLPSGIRFFKFGPRVAGQSAEWFELASGAVSLSGDRRTVSYSITDNQAGDSNAAVGVVEDPFAPMLLQAVAPAGTTSIPTLSDAGLALMSALVGLLAWRRRRFGG